MSKYKLIDVTCRYCGADLAARWEPTLGRGAIDGCEPHELIHADSGKKDCFTAHKATADGWKVSKALKTAERAERDVDDRYD